MKRPRILVVGSYMMDLIAAAPRVPNLGETVIGTSFQTAPGGKGANQAVQCARLGADVVMAGCVGDDSFGQEMLEVSRASGVDVSKVKISKKHRSGCGQIQLETGKGSVQNRILVVPGANYDLEPEDLGWLPEEIKAYDMVLLQLELTPEITKYTAKCAYEARVPVMLNPAPAAPLDKELLECVTYLSPNEHEAALLAEHPLQADAESVNEQDLQEVTARLLARGVQHVIVTLGGNGAAAADDTGIVRVPCVRMEDVKDPTAAGDSFVGAFCTGVSAGLTEKEALYFAGYTAALTVCEMGAMPSLPDIARVTELMDERRFDGFDIGKLKVLG